MNNDYDQLIMDELNIKQVEFFTDKELSVELDTNISPELLREGIARTIIRELNNYRKELKLTIKDRITLTIDTDNEDIKKSVGEHEKWIKESVQADKLLMKKVSKGKTKKIKAK